MQIIKVNRLGTWPLPNTGISLQQYTTRNKYCFFNNESILTEFQGLASSITLNIITLPTSGKSVVVKNLP